ncbi:MAG: transaldolase [Planctomycetota bacterium]|nr:transaldolase [Planctomycetota bacterium]
MKYFLDSAKLDEIEEAYATFGVDGVTTNPRHIQASGKPFMAAIEDMAKWAANKNLADYRTFPISVEVNPHLENADEMVREARKIAAISKNFVIKIPCIEPGIAASRILEREGIRTNLTLVFSPSQAIAAGRNKTLFVSPFLGWKEANGEDAKPFIQSIADIYRVQKYQTEIICAAVRTGKQIADCAAAGAQIITAGLAVYKDSFKHPYTRNGLELFRSAWDRT